MVTQHRPVIRSEIMSGWKDIANYLGKGVRTVQRYEREGALPVHRPPHKKVGSVVARKGELDAWVAAMPSRATFPLNKTHLETSDAAVFLSLNRNFAEAVRLREETARLRKDLHKSVETLRACIELVRCHGEEQDLQFRASHLILFDRMQPKLNQFLPQSRDSDRHQSRPDLKTHSRLRRAA